MLKTWKIPGDLEMIQKMEVTYTVNDAAIFKVRDSS